MTIRKFLKYLLMLLVFTSIIFGSSSSIQRGAAMPISEVDESKVPHYFGPYPNWALSPLTLPNVAVNIVGDGVGAQASASVGGNGSVTAITITNPGSGYTSATVGFTSTNGAGAQADAVVSTSGVVTSIVVDANGAGYITPTVTISGGGTITQATATAYGSVYTLTLDTFGSGYSMPTVDFDMPDDPNGVQAKAHATFDTTSGAITGIFIDNPGSGYATAPNVVIRDGTIFAPLNNREQARARDAREQILAGGTISPNGTTAITDATAHATIDIQEIKLDTYGSGYTSAPLVDIGDMSGSGSGASATAFTDVGAVTAINLTAGGTGYITAGGIQKFQDGLPMLCDPSIGCSPNNLGQYVPLGVPDTTTFSIASGFGADADYYVIALVQHRERMSSSLPVTGTLLREYVQLETPANASWSKSVPLYNDLLDGTSVPAMMPDGITQAVAVDDPHYMGPIIAAQKDKPVRIVFYNLLPTGSDGDLFIPVDTTFMGSGMGPMDMMPPMDAGTVMDGIRNPMCGEANKSDMDRSMCFAETRASIHLHGGITPWISDGSPHQWITPANEKTGWPEGVAVSQVPDMVGTAIPAGVPDCSSPTDGCSTFYYTNQQSARLMFYHDHAWGITRLNVYAGEAAGYLITDPTEQALFGPTGTFSSLGEGIPLVIQDRTFVPSVAQMAQQDPTWDYTRWGSEGDLWYEHVYMPAQNPNDPSGMSAYGRWFYGPWFWPPVTPTYDQIANPYFGKDPLGPDGTRYTADDFTTDLAVPCNLDDPTTWQYDTDPYCEPPTIPGTPNNSAGMEQFNDTPIVNGTAYPTITLDPKSYRLRILNAANDRFWNLQWYVADPTTGTLSEVALNPAELAAAQTDPNIFPTPLESMVDPVSMATVDLKGPDWIQIGTEGGFLPAPVVVDGQQETTWIIDPTRFDVGNVDQHSLLLAPAERADVIVDFSQFAGKTLIMYNDAPAAFPARISTYDYYTGAPDLSPNGAPTTLPGYGPNTRTIMQVVISTNAAAPAFNLTALNAAFRHHADGSGVFESGQNPTIVGQAGYNSAYGTSFASGSWCNNPADPSIPCDGFARISEQGGDIFKFDTLVGTQIGVKIEPKALHDEMNSTNFEPYGRMSGNIGVEVVPADPVLQNVVLYPFVNPPTELFDGTNLPSTDTLTPISVGTDGTQIWKITHNGVDTHPIHFHLYDVQLLNRVTWDNIIIPPDATELGWKDTVRVSPLEDTYFAIRPIIPVMPFELPNSIRPLNPMMPLGDTSMFNPTDVNGNPVTAIANHLVNFGWEYMLHCHILSHEEMDMMRPVGVAIPPIAPDGLLARIVSQRRNTATVVLTWNDNSISETSFAIERSSDSGVTWEQVGTVDSPLDQPNTKEVRTYTDTVDDRLTYQYRVIALNTIGDTTVYAGSTGFPTVTAKSAYSSPAIPIIVPSAPTNLAASLLANPTRVSLTWSDNATNETGFYIEVSVNSGAFTRLADLPPRNNTGNVTYVDSTVVQGNTYAYRVVAYNANGLSLYTNTVTITVDIPAVPSDLAAIPVRSGNRERVALSWTDNANNETGFTLQWSATSDFAVIAGSANLGPNSTTYLTTNIARQVWYFRIRANNVLGSSAWVTTAGI